MQVKSAGIGMNMVGQFRVVKVNASVNQGNHDPWVAVGITPGGLDVDQVEAILFAPLVIRIIRQDVRVGGSGGDGTIIGSQNSAVPTATAASVVVPCWPAIELSTKPISPVETWPATSGAASVAVRRISLRKRADTGAVALRYGGPS